MKKKNMYAITSQSHYNVYIGHGDRLVQILSLCEDPRARVIA